MVMSMSFAQSNDEGARHVASSSHSISQSSASKLLVMPIAVICDMAVFLVVAAVGVVVIAVLVSVLTAVVVAAHVAAHTLFTAFFQMSSIVRTHAK